MAIPLMLAPIIATFAKQGLGLVGEALIKNGKDWVEKKTGIKLSESMSTKDLVELQKWQAENETLLEKIAQENLSARHKADMASDSWLSKNVRPLCLLFLTLAICIGVYLPESSVDDVKFKALTDMGVWVYGYYFVGRSTFDKGNVKMNFGKALQ